MLRLTVLIMTFFVYAAGGASARPRHIDATPFAHAPCSVLDGVPCTPSTCSVFNHGPCIPEIDYPIGENLQVTVLSVPGGDDATRYQRPDHDLDTLGDLFAMLRSCWSPPAQQEGARAGMQMSVMFSFNKAGTPIAAPRMTFASRDAPSDSRQTYLKSIDASLEGCLPLRFTRGLAGAIAGRPIMIRYVDNRDLQNTAKQGAVLSLPASSRCRDHQRCRVSPRRQIGPDAVLLRMAAARAITCLASAVRP